MRYLLAGLLLFLTAAEVFSWDVSMGPGLSVKNAVLYLIAMFLLFRIAVSRGERLMPLGLAWSSPFQGFQPQEEPVSNGGELGKLTLREREVLGYIAAGADNLKIAACLGITERTVKAHITSIYKKLGPENRTQLAVLACQLGVQRPASV